MSGQRSSGTMDISISVYSNLNFNDVSKAFYAHIFEKYKATPIKKFVNLEMNCFQSKIFSASMVKRMFL